jgi:myo-inositol-hexaphosphate 3-phosphohydrolase
MDELLKHKDEAGVIGDLARELLVIMNDYKLGNISLEEKNELVDEVIKIYAAHDSADKELISRWAIKVTQQLLSVVV